MHDCMFQHRIDAVVHAPSRGIDRPVEPLLRDAGQREAPALEQVIEVGIGLRFHLVGRRYRVEPGIVEPSFSQIHTMYPRAAESACLRSVSNEA